MGMTDRPAYLIVVASSCQMYSGTGTAIFDFVDHCAGDFEFSFLMDVGDPTNFAIANQFCRDRSLSMYPSEPLFLPGCIDSGVAAVATHLASHCYDFVECVSWANAGTNLAVLETIRGKARLLYTPHSQPLWTLPDHSRYFMVSSVFRRMIRESDAVFVDSAAETDLDEFLDCDRSRVHVVPLGVDTRRFRDIQSHQPKQIVCVCDTREARKRVDLLLAAFEMAVTLVPDLQLVLGGKGSDQVAVPPHLKSRVKGLGYVSAADLVKLYQTSGLFVLLSDYEAFGLPIAEALCCGVPVLLNKLDVLEDLFSGLPGVYWTVNSDVVQTGSLMAQIATTPPDSALAHQAVRRFAWEGTYGRKRNIILGLPDREHGCSSAYPERRQPAGL